MKCSNTIRAVFASFVGKFVNDKHSAIRSSNNLIRCWNLSYKLTILEESLNIFSNEIDDESLKFINLKELQ